jgi:hypothetical protein
MLKKQIFFLLIFSYWMMGLQADSLMLRDNLQQARPGDYLVIAAGKTNSLMHIYAKKDNIVTIEEVVIPETKCLTPFVWKAWLVQGAPGHTSWVMYDIDLKTGEMLRYYSFTKRGWFDIPDADNFLSKLLNLRLTKIPDQLRRKVGAKPFSSNDRRPLWQPRLVLEGQLIKNVPFNAWKTQWPKDGTDLSGKTIEIYLPYDNQLYPSYFPYWLQINGVIGKAKIRMIDSGRSLVSPKPPLNSL